MRLKKIDLEEFAKSNPDLNPIKIFHTLPARDGRTYEGNKRRGSDDVLVAVKFTHKGKKYVMTVDGPSRDVTEEALAILSK